MDKIYAPFTQEQVTRLNSYQVRGRFHPFTCAGDHPSDRELVAEGDGWVCRHCDYRQHWAWSFMADGSMEGPFTDPDPLV